MNVKDVLKIDLKQKLNKREKIIFGAALLVFLYVFADAKIVVGYRAIADAKKQLQTLAEGKKVLLTRTTLEPTPIQQKKFWVGPRDALKQASDAFLQPRYFAGTTIVNSQFSKEAKAGVLTYKDVKLTLEGDFFSLGRTVENFENFRAPLVIKNITITPSRANIKMIRIEIDGGIFVH